MKKLTATTAQSPEALLNDLRALVRDAEFMLNTPPDAAGAEAFIPLRARLDAAREAFAALGSAARKKIAAWGKCTDRGIRANPYESLAIALAAGLLTGVVMGRRGH